MSPLIRDARPEEYDSITRLLRDTYGGEGLVGAAYLPRLDDTAARARDAGTEVLVAVDRTDPGDPTDPGSPAAHGNPAGPAAPANPAAGRPSGTSRLLGTATLALPGAGWNDALSDGEATLRMLSVDPTARRRRIGTALIGECVARARLAGATALGLHTTDAMTAAHRLYTTSGFVRTPEHDTPARSGGTLRAYRRLLEPWPRIRVAQSGEHTSAGDLTVAAYVGAGLLPADHSYVHQLGDAKRRAAEAELLVAVDPAGALLGTVTYCPPGSTYREIGRDDEGEFRMLAVSPQAHGRGIGEALVRTCLRRARSEGKRGIALSSSTAMHAAHRLYERLGFARDPRRDWTPAPGVSLLAFAREI
ncbi:GNAT family N-acetyltransferase [Actinopolymorpha sp. B11F2]|uniref:GNAT family N-acetyltransferase n=1 Tax=Actinopolymorpha sp. B11F2 TaxID=3160862 RepID=UPI0032E42B75